MNPRGLNAIGLALLSLWCGLNLLPSLGIIFMVVVLGLNAPAVADSLSPAQVSAVDPRLLANVNGIAVFANGTNAAFCTLCLLVAWRGVRRSEGWALPALGIALALALLGGIASDYAAGWRHPEVNVISAAILAGGVFCLARHQRSTRHARRERASGQPRPQGEA